MIIVILSVLFVVSFLWALFALHKEEKVHGKITHAKKELHREKILFKNS